MMKKHIACESTMQKTLNIIALTGETMVVVAAALWLFAPAAAGYVMAVGAVLFVVGRMAGNHGDGVMAGNKDLKPTVRHLYRQRILSYVLLALAVVAILLPPGFYFGIYMRASMWLLPFIAFVVIEAYTAFRLPAAEK